MVRSPALVLTVVLAAALCSLSPARAKELQARLAAGEVITSCQEVAGSSLQQAEAKGVVEATPARVWQVVTDVNNFQDFMPNTLKSRAVAPELIPAIVRRQPTKPREVEALLGPAPLDTSSCRVPGQKYLVYLYSLLDFPWPAANRWYIIKICQDETQAARGCYASSWSLECGNLKENRGEWLLEPFGDHKTQSRLGMEVKEISILEARKRHLNSRDGVLIARVYPQGPAARAGLEVGDIVYQINQQPLRGPKDYHRIVEQLHQGQEALLLVRDWRTGETGYLTVGVQ